MAELLIKMSIESIDIKEKKAKKFRNYTKKPQIAQHYLLNHRNQTYHYVKNLKKQILPLRKHQSNIFDIIRLMDQIIDESDPDTKKPQIIHALQTGEACRKAHPDKDWFHLLGFIHDLGKVIAHEKLYNLPKWAVVGDTFPVGCQFSKQIIFTEFFDENQDSKNELYNTEYGIYEPGCGFDQMEFSFGHDEYMYQVLKHNHNSMPEEALYVIRFHSFYPWHQNLDYERFASDKDRKNLDLLKTFQKCDLMSKHQEMPKIEESIKYYEGLIKKYFLSTDLWW
jgi:inositol oxygenase